MHWHNTHILCFADVNLLKMCRHRQNAFTLCFCFTRRGRSGYASYKENTSLQSHCTQYIHSCTNKYCTPIACTVHSFNLLTSTHQMYTRIPILFLTRGANKLLLPCYQNWLDTVTNNRYISKDHSCYSCTTQY